eukprot:TRINITY_DN7448_c0_g1_i1.p1 TRINITY_DN7448_c0_g1~~TRINITY_DN7448_c0_g1_i1.p1  ORF type:complete len:838 (-),score=232.33 TRINITY_DN7448_c0_g1_i1:76-2589(-)
MAAASPQSGKAELAGLRAFLRSRCGSIKAAFSALDAHDIGQVTSDDFIVGLQRLGYQEDAASAFLALDTARAGLVTLKTFMQGLGERGAEASEDVWRSARIVKNSSDKELKPHSQDVGSALKSSSALRNSSIDLEGSGAGCASPSISRPHVPVAGADLLYARMSRVEEQLAAEQRHRSETEQRLTQHLNSLVGVSISEQLDVLRQQLIEERMQRQVDISALRASIDSSRLLGLRSLQEDFEQYVKVEVDKSVSDARVKLEDTCRVKRTENASADLEQKLQDLSETVGARIGELEASVKDVTGGTSPKSPGRLGLRLERQIHVLQRNAESLEERMDHLASSMEAQAKQALQLKEDVLAALPDLNAAGSGADWEKVCNFVCVKTGDLRTEWNAALEEERSRSCERAQALCRALTQEFEQSIVSQAVAEARTEARAAVTSEVDTRFKDVDMGRGSVSVNEAVQRAVEKLAQDIEALRSLGCSEKVARAQEDLFDRVKSLEAAQQETGKENPASVQALESLQQRVQGIEENMLTKLQAIVNKLDSKCLESLLPVLEGIGAAFKDKPRIVGFDKSSPQNGSGFCSANSTSSGSGTPQAAKVHRQSSANLHEVHRQSSANLHEVHRQSSANLHEVHRQSSANLHEVQLQVQPQLSSLERASTNAADFTEVQGLLQENLRLREAEVSLREANLALRERAAKMQEEGTAPKDSLGASFVARGAAAGGAAARSMSPQPAQLSSHPGGCSPQLRGQRPVNPRTSLSALSPPHGGAARPMPNGPGSPQVVSRGVERLSSGVDTASMLRAHRVSTNSAALPVPRHGVAASPGSGFRATLSGGLNGAHRG